MNYINHNPHELTRHMLRLTILGLRNQQDAGLDGVTVRQLAEWLLDRNQGPLQGA
jgi:hypothetical protein